ncbi:PelD GGDEF domain-containing protein [Alcanivorax sp. S6407]|uniref:PelD GGDEF domain-containing protein n=1 Tax=Alcanivorax sp. S6407 TaxID=2926424 RepID=UPI001FF19D72|nr:PelD GGDEF domain-containing protein [Alcanivorax sp. S6407]MCK0152888.1 PelD GGDEF domain-containing protein [Alcanivorax sp. S6407]
MLERVANGKLTQWLSPSVRVGWSMLETVLLTAATVGIGLWLRPDDPMTLTAEFHWIMLVPLVIAMRYGGLVGVWAMLCLIGSWFLLNTFGVYGQQPFPEGAMLGGLIFTLVAGEFSDLWRVRMMRADSAASYSLERLQNLTQRFVLLRLSHDRLEENLLTKPYTVRDALFRLRTLALEESNDATLPGGDDLLGILAEYCQLQRAALYPCHDGVISDTPAALLGENKPLEKNNELLAHALENQLLAHVQQEGEENYHGAYIVAAPVSNSAGKVIGMLAVERMPFLSVNYENLQLLSVLLNFYADVVYAGKDTRALLEQWPELPFQMARELVALGRLREEGKVETSLTLFVADDSEQAGLILDALARGLRSLDLAWWISDRTLLIMMPMTGVSGLEGFVLRTEQWLQDEFAFISLRQAGVQFFYRHMDTRPTNIQLVELLEAGGV